MNYELCIMNYALKKACRVIISSTNITNITKENLSFSVFFRVHLLLLEKKFGTFPFLYYLCKVIPMIKENGKISHQFNQYEN